MKPVKIILLSFVFTVPALAQTNGTFQFRVSGVASPSSPSVTVEVWAAWDQTRPGEWALKTANFDLVASDGLWSDPQLLFNGPASGPGTPNGSNLVGAFVNQGGIIHPPPNVNASNPFPLIRAVWTTSDFIPRNVQLRTDNTQYFLLADPATWFQFNLVPDEFTPGSGVINVVPAPAAWLVLALPLLAATRRRRC